jgi:methionyl-tRNA synthetase
MTTCDYCSGTHDRDHCPNCGAPRKANLREESRPYREPFPFVVGFPGHYFNASSPPKRPLDTVTA